MLQTDFPTLFSVLLSNQLHILDKTTKMVWVKTGTLLSSALSCLQSYTNEIFLIVFCHLYYLSLISGGKSPNLLPPNTFIYMGQTTKVHVLYYQNSPLHIKHYVTFFFFSSFFSLLYNSIYLVSIFDVFGTYQHRK